MQTYQDGCEFESKKPGNDSKTFPRRMGHERWKQHERALRERCIEHRTHQCSGALVQPSPVLAFIMQTIRVVPPELLVASAAARPAPSATIAMRSLSSPLNAEAALTCKDKKDLTCRGRRCIYSMVSRWRCSVDR